MSTQHPDNASNPEWNKEEVINGNAEVLEAYYAYSILGCQEVMWDSEGKDTDTCVARKLLQKYWDYFASHTIGEDIFLTYRIPNPKIEVPKRKSSSKTSRTSPSLTMLLRCLQAGSRSDI
jgi:phosphoenolpyruvate carboxylase